MKSNLFIIAKSGWKYIGYSFGISIFFFLLDLEVLAFIVLLCALFLLYHFRNPERELPLMEKKSILSPVDGTIVSIETLKDSDYGYAIEIESSCWDVSVLRAPCSAEIVELQIIRGSRVGKKSKLFSLLNEYAEIVFKDEDQKSTKVIHRLQQGFAPITIDCSKNQKLMQGKRYGMAQNSITTVYIDKETTLQAVVGQTVFASTTLLSQNN